MKNLLIDWYARKTYNIAVKNYMQENPSVIVGDSTWELTSPGTKDFWRGIAWRRVRIKASNLFRQAWGWAVVIYGFAIIILTTIVFILIAIFGGSIKIRINFESVIKLLQQITGS